MVSQSGSMRFVGTVLRRDDSQKDAGNNPIISYDEVANRRCSLIPKRGFETAEGNQTSEITFYRIEMRNDSITRDIRSRDQIKINRRTFEISVALDYGLYNSVYTRFDCAEIL